MPDRPSPQLQHRLRDALRLLVETLPSTSAPQELKEIAAARRLVELARELETETVRDARRVPSKWRDGAAHQTFVGTPLTRIHSWRAIGRAAGMTGQSAHERWAGRL